MSGQILGGSAAKTAAHIDRTLCAPVSSVCLSCLMAPDPICFLTWTHEMVKIPCQQGLQPQLVTQWPGLLLTTRQTSRSPLVARVSVGVHYSVHLGRFRPGKRPDLTPLQALLKRAAARELSATSRQYSARQRLYLLIESAHRPSSWSITLKKQ